LAVVAGFVELMSNYRTNSLHPADIKFFFRTDEQA